MNDLFKALQNIKIPERKTKFKVTIEGKDVEVPLKLHREILKHGPYSFMWKGTEIVRKPPPEIKRGYKVMKKTDDDGYDFYDNDPFWPKKIIKGGFKWGQE